MLVFAILFSSFVSAEFLPPADLNPAPEHFQQAITATGKIKVTVKDSRCTAFFVSSDGYALTNLHCIQECLQNNRLLANGAEQSEWGPLVPTETSEFHNLWRSGDQTPSGINCRYVSFDFMHTGGSLYGSPQLIAIGRGFGTVNSKNIDQLSEADYQQLADHIDDYAILKFDTYNQAVSCHPIGDYQPRSGDKLFSVGFPMQTFRENEGNSDGRRQFSTYGSSRLDIKEDQHMQGLGLSERSWERQADLTGRPRFLKTTLDVAGGASGSPVLSSDGKAIAILYSSTGTNTQEPNRGTTMAIKTSHIYDETLRHLGGQRADEIFNCKHPQIEDATQKP